MPKLIAAARNDGAQATFSYGTVVGNDYMVLRRLKQGSMGAVYLAEQLSTAAPRALKILRPEYIADPTLFKRFEREAQVGARIASDHVAQVLAAGVDARRQVPWIAMEYLEGQDLGDHIEEGGPLSLGKARSVFAQLGHALAAAHRIGVIHRDLKPSNVFLASSRRSGDPTTVKVLDFGIARVATELLTLAGAPILGTLPWMAPEQVLSGEVTPRADVWSIGLLAFFVLTGKRFWLSCMGKNHDGAVTREICHAPIPIASTRALELGAARPLPRGFDEWFAQCVARAHEERFVGAVAAYAALDQVMAG